LIAKNYDFEKLKQTGFHSESNCELDHEIA
jgi:hypothetical protein